MLPVGLTHAFAHLIQLPFTVFDSKYLKGNVALRHQLLNFFLCQRKQPTVYLPPMLKSQKTKFMTGGSSSNCLEALKPSLPY